MRQRLFVVSVIFTSFALVPLAPSSSHAEDVPSGVSIPAQIQNDLKDGDTPVSYKITAEIRDGKGNILAPAGSTGIGKVVQYRRPAGFGGPGKTEVSLDEIITPDGKHISVKAKSTKYGKDARFASIFLLGPSLIGYFTTGGSGKIGTGTNLTFTSR